jgi:hypothetical protein
MSARGRRQVFDGTFRTSHTEATMQFKPMALLGAVLMLVTA